MPLGSQDRFYFHHGPSPTHPTTLLGACHEHVPGPAGMNAVHQAVVVDPQGLRPAAAGLARLQVRGHRIQERNLWSWAAVGRCGGRCGCGFQDASRNNKLLVTSATLVVTSALLVVTRS